MSDEETTPRFSLSLILPIKNAETGMKDLMHFLATQIKQLPKTELIMIDIGSTDNTVLAAVQSLHAEDLCGCVMQNGDTTVAAGLNTGLARANGTYVSFLFAHKLYKNSLPAYCQAAARTHADLIFGCWTPEAASHAAKRLPGAGPDTTDFARQLLKGSLALDLSAVLIRSQFLVKNGITFSEECRCGYAEEFLLRCLFMADTVYQSPVFLERGTAHELPQMPDGHSRGTAVLQKVDAMVRVLDILHTYSCGTPELMALFQEEYIPKTVLSCIDTLLNEGFRRSTIHLYLQQNGYDKLLLTGSKTDPVLRNRIFLWKACPLFYHTETSGEKPNTDRHTVLFPTVLSGRKKLHLPFKKKK